MGTILHIDLEQTHIFSGRTFEYISADKMEYSCHVRQGYQLISDLAMHLICSGASAAWIWR